MSRPPPFKSLIAERIAAFHDELANVCENHVSEREEQFEQLLEENLNLHRENIELRRQLQLQTPRTSDENGGKTTQDSMRNESPVKSSRKPARSGTETSTVTSQTQTFHLLDDLHKKSGEEVHLQGTSAEAIESADRGFAVLNHRSTSESAVKVSTSQLPVLDPSSTPRLSWDIFGIPVLSWDLVTIPLGVFDISFPGFVDWIIRLYWTFDIPLTFFTGIYDDDGVEVYDHKKIARKYFHGAFFLDVFMVISDWTETFLDIILEDGPPGALGNVALLRILRISRFARLIRLRKLTAKLRAAQDLLHSEWYLHLIDLLIKLLVILCINHYICCGWYAIGASNLADPEYRWLASVPYPLGNSDGRTLADAPFGYRYTTTLHWAISQFTPGNMNILPQNSYERLYNVLVLFFGMAMFSSVIASVTQARLQMSKMRSKFETDYWLLREFCRQHRISQSLQRRMKRYIDIVVVPTQAKLQLNEVTLVNRLSPMLRHQFTTEIFSEKVGVHPFLAYVYMSHCSVFTALSAHALETLPLARGDVAFSGGQKAQFMMVIVSGMCDYIPIMDQQSHEIVTHGQWASEAVLWTGWLHQGQLQATHDTQAMCLDGVKFRAAVLRSVVCMRVVRKYGAAFCDNLNLLVRRNGTLTDLDDFAKAYFSVSGMSSPVSGNVLGKGNLML